MAENPAGAEQADAEHAPGGGVGEVHWSYAGETGPDRWGGLDPSLAVCDSGMRQSPVDVAGAMPAGEAGAAGEGGLDIQWQSAEARVVDNGHTIQVDVAEGSYITLDSRRFSLAQFHFHLPSEHTVEGESFPMEVHFVHQAGEGDLAVIGVFLEEGGDQPAIETVWNAISGPDEAFAMIGGFDPRRLLPEGRARWRYTGSLTTPPCSEVVSWIVMTEPISVSRAQADAFAALYPMNARPVQPLNERAILMRP